MKLKEPTLKDMCKVGELFAREDLSSILAGEKMIDLLLIVYEETTREELEKISPEKAREMLENFFTKWKPTKWIYGNTEIFTKYTNSLQSIHKQEKTG